jgi:hypothetical protein
VFGRFSRNYVKCDYLWLFRKSGKKQKWLVVANFLKIEKIAPLSAVRLKWKVFDLYGFPLCFNKMRDN